MQDVLTLPLPGLAPPRAYHGRVQSASDEVLARRAADGDESAFEELVVRYQDRLYTLALRITMSEADAYDCVQEGLVSAWRGLGSFRFNARFSTWMYRIVVRKAYDVLERRSRTAEPVDEVPATSVDSPVEARLDLLGALSALEPEFRVVAVACDVVGTISRQRLHMRNEMFGHPLSPARCAAITAGDITPWPLPTAP